MGLHKKSSKRRKSRKIGYVERYKRSRKSPPPDSTDSDSDYTNDEETDSSYTLGSEDTESTETISSDADEKPKTNKTVIVFNIDELTGGSCNDDDDDDDAEEDNNINSNNPELKYYTKNEKIYYNKLSEEERSYIDALEARLKDINEKSNGVPRRFKLLNSEMDEKTKALVIQKMDYLDRMSGSESEYIKLSFWMDAVMRLPIGKYKKLPVNSASSRTDIKDLLVKTKSNLDERVYGHTEVKDHIVRILAQWVSNPKSKGMVIGIQGSPGVGKTTLVKNGVCNSLDLPFVFMPLGGMADRAEFVGHSYTYEGARWGKIVDSLMVSGCSNPVFFFDELDKVSGTKNGEDIINILMQLTDPSQNDKFHDSYFSDFTFDLSRCIMIFSYNNESEINPILRDRMIRIATKGYKLSDKLSIAQKHLIPEILQEFNLATEKISFSDDIIKFIVDYVENEEGVRNLKRALHDIISNIHLNILIGNEVDGDVLTVMDVTKKDVIKFVHKKHEANNALHNYMYL